jgi:predicted PurR-regulated permease PerM
MNFLSVFKIEAYRFASYVSFLIFTLLLHKLRFSFAILFGSVAFAIICSPISIYLKNTFKLHKKLAVVFSVLILTFLILLPLVLIFPVFLKNINYFLKFLKFNYPVIKTYLVKYSNILRINGVNFDSWSEIVTQLSSYTGNFANLIADFTIKTLNIFWITFILPLLTIIVLANSEAIWTFTLSMFPSKIRNSFQELAQDMAANLRKCFFSEVKIACALTILYSFLLGVAGVKNFLIFGIAFGMFSFLPYLGFLICSVSLYTNAFLSDQSFGTVFMLFGVLTFGQIIDALFISSRIIGNELCINSGVVLIILLLFIPVFGFLGALLVIPCIAIFMPVLDRFRKLNL